MGGSESKEAPRKPNGDMVERNVDFVGKIVRLRGVGNGTYIGVKNDGLAKHSDATKDTEFHVASADGKVTFESVRFPGRFLGANSGGLKLRPHALSLEKWDIYRKDVCRNESSDNVYAIYCANESTNFKWVSCGKEDLIHDWASWGEEFELVEVQLSPLDGVHRSRHILCEHANRGSEPVTRTIQYTTGVRDTSTSNWNINHRIGLQFSRTVRQGHYQVHSSERSFSTDFSWGVGGSTTADHTNTREDSVTVIVPPGKKLTLYQLTFVHEELGLEMRCQSTLTEETDL